MGISNKLLAIAVLFAAAASHAETRGETLAGVLEYKGGFARDLVVKTAPGEFVKYFRIAVPSFCKGADVLETYTSVQGQKDQATMHEKSSLTFAVNGGNGQRIDSILVTLNGPSDAACTVPVYLVDKPGTIGPDPDPEPIPGASLQLCNRTFRTVYAALGYQVGGKYVSQGWWVLGGHRCVAPQIKGGLQGGEVYVYGRSNDGMVQWGIGPAFCVGPKSFRSTGAECQAFTPGYSWRPFSQHVFGFGKSLTVYFQ